MEGNKNKKEVIGFFDSGVGGLSVMKEAIKLMPNENFLYFGDSKNAPYGVKKSEEVKRLTFKAVDYLISKGAKAVVIACNTATSVSAEDLRKAYNNIPIIGIEPALKPAVEINKGGKIIVMATSVTLTEEKFKKLMDKYREDTDIIPLPCPGLMEFIECGELSGVKLHNFLKEKFEKIHVNLSDIESIVLGCTHYPFIESEIRKIVGNKVQIIDGSYGTSKELKRRLEEIGKLNKNQNKGNIEINNSINDKKIIDLCYKLLK